MPTTPDDSRVTRVLVAFAAAQPRGPELPLGVTGGLAAALAAEFGVRDGGDAPGGEADVARAATELLLQDPDSGPQIRALLDGPPPEQFTFIETGAVITAALLVLQTHVRIERKPDGRWSLLVLKKPTESALLNALISKLLPFLGKS
ncbi:MAG: hypothetical protein V4850_36670 [Myxococcota bacterium]